LAASVPPALRRIDPAVRPWLGLALAGAAVAAVLVARAGRYPAVMTGDEIWFSESAFNLIRHGIPQRLIHQDAVGSAVADFLPPIPMLVQALAFRALGLTPAAVAAQSVIAPLAAVGLIFLIARHGGASVTWAGLAGFAVMGSQLFLRAGLYIRYEALVAVCFLVYLLATRRADDRGGRFWHAVRGGALALAGLSYYPLAPFVGVAGLVFEVARWRRDAAADPSRRDGLIAMAAGFALPAAGFAAYVLGHPTIFAAQILGNGSSNYLTFELPRRLFDPGLWRQSEDTLPELIALALLLVAVGGSWRSHGRWLRSLYGAALIASLPAVIYPFYPRLLAVPVCLAILMLAAWTTAGVPWQRRVGRAGLVVGAAAAAVSCALMSVTAVAQRDARRYDAVAAALVRLVSVPGAAAIDQRAWLALRAADPARELHHVVPAGAGDQVRIFESTVLRDPAGGAHFRYVVLNAADADATIRATPALAAAFAAQRFVEIGRVAPPFRALPWARQAPYDLVVYARR
jgi:hypothetical protein